MMGIHQTFKESDRLVWVVQSGSFVKDVFEGIELKAGRLISRWNEVRDSTGKSIKIGDEGIFRKDFGGTITPLSQYSFLSVNHISLPV